MKLEINYNRNERRIYVSLYTTTLLHFVAVKNERHCLMMEQSELENAEIVFDELIRTSKLI